ncbi:hypothetical protein [Streptomyces sp. NPDC001621]|uniref:hypothetical protein n=1 Tax=Streptomyces sp. NPDC001621 TaxID=3364594 RepID=UPI0036785C8B
MSNLRRTAHAVHATLIPEERKSRGPHRYRGGSERSAVRPRTHLQEGADRHVTPEYRRHAYGRFSRIEETTLMLQGSGSDRDLGSAR